MTPDKKHWLRVLLRGHVEPLVFEISAADHNRLLVELQSKQDQEFVTFDTPDRRVALSWQDAIFAQLLHDYLPPGAEVIKPEGDADADLEPGVKVLFSGGTAQVDFGLDLEIRHPVTGSRAGGIADVFDALNADWDETERLTFNDADDEPVFLRRADIAIIDVALDLL